MIRQGFNIITYELQVIYLESFQNFKIFNVIAGFVSVSTEMKYIGGMLVFISAFNVLSPVHADSNFNIVYTSCSQNILQLIKLYTVFICKYKYK